MHQKLVFFTIFFIIIFMINPVYAEVTSLSIEEDSYTNEEQIVFIGTESEGGQLVNVALYNPNGKFINMFGGSSDSNGSFETVPRPVQKYFSTTGTYNATAFTGQISEGIFILLQYDGNQVSLLPTFVLELKKIGNKSVNEKQNLSFTASLTDSSLENLEFKLDKNPPTGATIDSKTGSFSWTPTEAQGPASYLFDIVVMKGPLEDRETITVTVNEATKTPSPQSEPEPTKNIPNFVDPQKGVQYYLDRYNNEPAYKSWFDDNFPDYTIEEAIELAIPGSFPEELEPTKNIPNFVDPQKGAQYYLDRYNNESAYKSWFDTNYPDYTIEEAIELAIPGSFPEEQETKPVLPFIDPNQDPQYYINRYNTEPSYKSWFDANYPDYTIYEAVGVEPTEPPKVGICGKGTHLIGDECVAELKGGGCLIATAAFGSEMAPQVQLLREIRDNTLLSTDSGSAFMNGFNSVYYTFSPTIADWERQNPVFKESVKLAITPLISTLAILNYLDIDSEEKMLGFGIGLILLNLGIYFIMPAIIVDKAFRIFRSRK